MRRQTDSSATYAKEKDVVFKHYADIPFLTSQNATDQNVGQTVVLARAGEMGLLTGESINWNSQKASYNYTDP